MRAIALLLAVVAVSCGPGPIIRGDAINETALANVERDLRRVRGLEFTASVPGEIFDDAQVAALLTRELEREFRPGDLARLGSVYERLGMMPAGTSFEDAIHELYSDQLAAFYDPRTKKLALTAGGLRQVRPWSVRTLELFTRRDLLGEVLVAHELTHALQDQHYGLPTTAPPITDAQGDRTIARRALLEGDASLASVAYLTGGPLDPGTVQRFVEQVSAIPEELRARHPNVPPVIRASLAFQYNTGSLFAAAAYLRGGWAAVDAAHRDPPVSTEQVLHHDKYFGVRDQPRTVAIGGTERLERAGWTRILEDTFGEFDVRILVGLTQDPLRAAAVAGGWGGDRCRVLERHGELVIVWLSVWDTEADAIEFAEAMPAIVHDAAIERRDARVLLVIGPERDALARRVWTESRVSPEA